MEENKKSREIDVIGIIAKVLKEKKLLAKFLVVFFIGGAIVALNTQKYYTTTVVLAPESTDNTNLAGKLGSMTSVLGISLNGNTGSDAIYPELYPDVFASTDFQTSLFNVPVVQQEETKSKPYCEHLMRDEFIPFWKYPSIWLKKFIKSLKKDKFGNKKLEDVDPRNLSKDQWAICKAISSQIVCTVDKKTGVITLSVTDIDPLVSTIMADTVMHRLQSYMTDYRTKKARHDLDYINKMTEQAHDEYIQVQKAYAKATDSHRDLLLMVYQQDIDDLENEMQTKYTVYSELQQQQQLARQRVQERTPVFTIIQSPTIPIKPSSMPRILIVLAYMIIGAIVDALWVLEIRQWWQNRRKNK